MGLQAGLNSEVNATAMSWMSQAAGGHLRMLRRFRGVSGVTHDDVMHYVIKKSSPHASTQGGASGGGVGGEGVTQKMDTSSVTSATTQESEDSFESAEEGKKSIKKINKRNRKYFDCTTYM